MSRFQDWRALARDKIHHVLVATDGMPEDIIELELRAAYPFPRRHGIQWEAWLVEIRAQRDERTRKAEAEALERAKRCGPLFNREDE